MPKLDPTKPYPIKLFHSRQAWVDWLAENHTSSPGIWLQISKKGAPSPSVTYKEALEVALCYGWIDGQKRPESTTSWLQKFVPRAPKSIWSKVNREKALALIASGEMQAPGLKAVADARQCGRWDSAYDSPSTAAVPDDLASALASNPAASAFFETLDKANRYAILWRIQTVKKQETRARKISQFVDMLARHEKLHK